MRYDTQSVLISAEAEEVTAFLADGANLARWAIGFAKAVEPADDGWIVTTASGDRVVTRIVADVAAGTVDFVMTSAAGGEARAWSRVVGTPAGALYSFSQVQPTELPDEVFDGQVDAVTHELVMLKALIEVDCPL